jgi:uncharacterized membrane protein HdeD (DUF308 family)
VTDVDVERSFREAARYWWIFLVIGAGWLVFAMIVFRFDWRSVSAISILFGIVVIAAAIDEVFAVFAGERIGWARFGHALLALAFFVIGIVAFVHPGNTFAALAAVMSFYFVLKGMLDVGLAVALRHETATWSLQLLLGIAEILIGFWAAGDFRPQDDPPRRVGWRARAHAWHLGNHIFAFGARELRGIEPSPAG